MMCMTLLGNQIAIKLDLCKWDGCAICEFLIDMAGFACYDPQKSYFQNYFINTLVNVARSWLA